MMMLHGRMRFQEYKYIVPVFLLFMLLNGCTLSRYKVHYVKDNKQNTWNQYNSRINQHYWKFKSSRHVEISLDRAQRYLPYIHQVFRQYHLPPELAYLPILESAFDVSAVSRTGAKGLWQFKAATARHVGLNVGWLRDDRLNWKKSTIAAAKYLDSLGKRFNYNWELALAAYNGGPSYISKLMKQQHSWNFWHLEMRSETQQYVPKFLAILRVARERYPNLYYRGAPRFWVASRY